MQEFLKLNWRIRGPADLEQQTCFLTEEAVSDLHVYKHFTRSIFAPTAKHIKLHVSNEKHVPGKKYYRFIPRRSLIPYKLKRPCLQAMKLIQSGKNPEAMTASEKACMKMYSNCHAQILEENCAFQECIKDIWNRYVDKPIKIKCSIQSYSWFNWKQRIKRYIDYPQFYKNHSIISFAYNDNDVQYQHLQNLIEHGTVARFTQMSSNVAFNLKIITLPVADDKKNPATLPVSQDSHIPPLLEKNPVDIIISSSALKQLSDCTDTNIKWQIPVKIEEVECNGKMRKVVFIDKVLPKPKPTFHDLKMYAYKKLVKTNFCQYEAFGFDLNKCEQESEEEIDEEMEVEETEEAEVVNKKKKKKGRTKKIHHNVSYRIWNIKKSNQNNLIKNTGKDNEIKLMVRCKLDGCEMNEQGALQPIVVKPKIEQQLQYGCNIPSKSELSREWTALFFRLFSNLYRIRIYAPMSEVISVEKCTLQKINTEAFTHYQMKPVLSLGVLQSVFEELLKLECGYYLLQHSPKNGAFISILHQSDEEQSTLDLYSEYENIEIDKHTKPNWLPIDVNYILPVHEDSGQLPATFKGFDSNINKKGSKNKKRKKKKAGKSKGQNDEVDEFDNLLIP